MTPEQRSAKVEKIRDSILKQHHRINATVRADHPARERHARIKEQLDQIGGTIPVQVNGRGNTFVRGVKLDKYAGMTGNLSQATALLFSLKREEIHKHLCAISDLSTNEEKAISREKREQIIADAKHTIFELGHEEEALIREAREHGQHILRRPDVDVRCVLGLAETMPEPHGI